MRATWCPGVILQAWQFKPQGCAPGLRRYHLGDSPSYLPFHLVNLPDVWFSLFLVSALQATLKSVQVFGRKKTATAVAFAKAGKGMIKINGSPIELIQPLSMREKVRVSVGMREENVQAAGKRSASAHSLHGLRRDFSVASLLLVLALRGGCRAVFHRRT